MSFAKLEKIFQSLAPLNPTDLKLIRSCFVPVSFAKKERLLDFQKVANHFYFINSGLVRLYGYRDGEEKTLFFFKENMIAGSIDSYLENEPSQLVLEALEPVEGLKISRQDLNMLLQSTPAMSKVGLALTQQRFQHLLALYSSFVLDSPEERYLKFLANSPDLMNRVPQHITASFLGITPVSLSRIRKRVMDK